MKFKVINIKNNFDISSPLTDNIIKEIRKNQLNKQIKNKDNNIKFIHITKTAGTTIENLGNENNFKWGRFDINYLKTYRRTKFAKRSVWHVPLKYFEKNPYENNLLFTIVRNPYTRCISEYYCPWSGNKNKNADVIEFNQWIRDKLTNNDIVSFLPYHEYFDFNNKIIINYVLYFENIQNEFNNLFTDIKLDRHDNKGTSSKRYDIDSLDNKTISMINNKYRKDFEIFGYDMI